jgi:hypothetical protein
MTTTQLLDEISKTLNGTPLSDIERDITLQQIQQLYSLVKNHAETIVPVQKAATQEIPVVKQVAIIEPPAINKPKPMLQSISLSDDDSVVASTETTIEEQDPYENISKAANPNAKLKTASLNEGFGKEDKSLNERLSSEKKAALNDDHATRRDLKSLIDLNKQFVFTNELFGGNSNSFMSAVNRIDNCATIQEAFEYIKTDIIPIFEWDSTQQSTKLFDKLVRQKFGVI